MAVLDLIPKDKQQLKSTITSVIKTTNKVGKGVQEVVANVANATTEFVEEKQKQAAARQTEKQETARKKEEAEKAAKQREAEIASGYYMENGQMVVSNLNGMKTWLQEIGKDSTPALLQVLQSQMQVLQYVESPSLTGMTINGIIHCMDKALRLTDDDLQRNNIREAFCAMLQNFVFMTETNLRCAEKEHSDEAARLLVQAGDMLSDSVQQVATLLVPAGKVSKITKAAVLNVFASSEVQHSYIKNVFSWLANKKLLKEKQDNFYQTLETLFETFDTHAERLGTSVLIHGMLRRYRHMLVERFRQTKIQLYIDRGYKIDDTKLKHLSEGLSMATWQWSNPSENKASAAKGAVTEMTAIGGLIVDLVNRSKKGLDIEVYCELQDALERECDRLKAEQQQAEQELEELKEQQKAVGLFKRSEKQAWQEKIDRKKQEEENLYAQLQALRTQRTNMQQLFPDSFSFRNALKAYEQDLLRIEQKFAV